MGECADENPWNSTLSKDNSVEIDLQICQNNRRQENDKRLLWCVRISILNLRVVAAHYFGNFLS